MSFFELLLTASGLSMDAFAVSLCKGFKMDRLSLKSAAVIALFFGGFQTAMPLIGWLLGKQFAVYIISFDHWIAFFLLAFIGGKMAYEALKNHGCPDESCGCPGEISGSGEGCGDGAGQSDVQSNVQSADGFDAGELFMLAVATSIDALAVGVTFAFLQVSIVPSVLLIGAITFALSFAGVVIGHQFGARYKRRAELSGGIVLILMGTKILLEHLGIL